jgi:hypothetical protein
MPWRQQRKRRPPKKLLRKPKQVQKRLKQRKKDSLFRSPLVREKEGKVFFIKLGDRASFFRSWDAPLPSPKGNNPQEPRRYIALNGFVEKRKSPRIEVRWPLTIMTETGAVEGEARNI